MIFVDKKEGADTMYANNAIAIINNEISNAIFANFLFRSLSDPHLLLTLLNKCRMA